MFLYNLFYGSIILIFYFDSDISRTECSLLSRAKNPIDISSENVDDAAGQDVYYELPGTLHRTYSPVLYGPEIASEEPETSAVAEYILNRLEPIRTSSLSRNVYRYKVEKPPVEPENLNRLEALKTFPPLDKLNRYEPKRTFSDSEIAYYYEPIRTTKANYRGEPSRTMAEAVNFSWPSRTFPALDKINRYEPLRTSVAQVKNYEDLITLMTPEDLNQYHSLETFPEAYKVNRYEPSRTIPDSIDAKKYDPMRTLQIDDYGPVKTIAPSENINRYEPFGTFPPSDNNYEPVRSSPPLDNYYRYEPLRTSTSEVAQSFQPQESINRIEPVRTYPSLDNIYRYEVLGTHQTVMNIHPKLPVTLTRSSYNFEPERSSPPEEPLISLDVYQYKSLRSSPSSEIVSRYGPLKFSALYLDEPTWTITRTSQNYIQPLESLANLNASARKYLDQIPLRTIALPTYSYRAKPSRSSTYKFFEPLRTTLLTRTYNKVKAMYQFTPFLIYRPTKSLKSIKSKTHFTPFLTPDTLTTNVNNSESFNTTKSPDDYWKEFMQIEPERTSRISDKNQDQRGWPSRTNEPLKTFVVDGNLYQLVPLETSRGADEYWIEFMKNEPLRTFGDKNTVPLRTNVVSDRFDQPPSRTFSEPVFVYSPSRSSTIPYRFDQPPLRTSQQAVEFYHPLRTSRSTNVYLNELSRTAGLEPYVYQHYASRTSTLRDYVYKNEPFRTSTFRDYIYKSEPIRTSTSQNYIYKNIPFRTSASAVYGRETQRLAENFYLIEPSRSSKAVTSLYLNITYRASKLEPSTYQSEPVRTSAPIDYSYQSIPLGTSSPTVDVYQKLPSRSSILAENFYHVKPFRTSSQGDYLYSNEPSRTSRVPEDSYSYEPSRTPGQEENFYQNEPLSISRPQQSVFQYIPLRTSSSKDYFYPHIPIRTSTVRELIQDSETIGITTEALFQSKVHQGFRTLWRPTLMTRTSIPRIVTRTTEQDLKPTRTTRLFNWIFNDDDAAWPKVELILATTERSTVPKKPKKTFATYFPFYLRTTKEATRMHPTARRASIRRKTKANRTSTTVKESTEIDKDQKEIPSFRREGDDNVIRCYSCGLNLSDIPYYPTCYHIFDMPGSIHTIKRNKYRVHCKNSARKQAKPFDIPAKRKVYRGGCFKRYVEFGEVYSERGCRTIEPLKGESFASLRLAYLERLLANVDEGCVVSPHASLTPFHRGISLYARYHACVCQGRYCNDTAKVMSSFLLIFLNIFLRI